MTTRERRMLLLVGALGALFLVIGGLYLVTGIRDGLANQDAQIAALTRDVKKSQERLKELHAAQARLNRWQEISLPPDTTVANAKYVSFLRELCGRHQFNNLRITESGLRAATARNTAQLTPLSYVLTADVSLLRFIGFLREFYGLNLPHSIREMNLTHVPGASDHRIDVTLRIEALALPTAKPRDFLVAVPDGRLLVLDAVTALKHGPVGFALAPWLIGPTGIAGNPKLAGLLDEERHYEKLVDKNVFLGLTAPAVEGPAVATGRPDRNVLKVVELTGITENFIATEAWLRNRLTNKTLFLRAEGGRDTFEIRDANDRLVLKGKVRHIENRSVIFETDDKFYLIRLGQFMDEALRKELDESDLKALGVSTATATGNP